MILGHSMFQILHGNCNRYIVSLTAYFKSDVFLFFFVEISLTAYPVVVQQSTSPTYRDMTLFFKEVQSKCLSLMCHLCGILHCCSSFYFIFIIHFFIILFLQKTNTDSSSVPVPGYYYMPFISLDPNHQLFVFPYTHTSTHTHTLLSFALSHCCDHIPSLCRIASQQRQMLTTSP